MGVIDSKPYREIDGPTFPDDMANIVDHYRRVKFSHCKTEDGAILTPRVALSFSEVESYNRLSVARLMPHEVALIMDIDGIFESRGDA